MALLFYVNVLTKESLRQHDISKNGQLCYMQDDFLDLEYMLQTHVS